MSFFFLGFPTIILLCIPGNVNSAVSQGEYKALIDIYNTMNGPNWSSKSNWKSGDPCSSQWTGVFCNGNSISELYLSYNNLTGTFPSSIFGLGNLTSLSAAGNSLFGNLSTLFNNFQPMISFV